MCTHTRTGRVGSIRRIRSIQALSGDRVVEVACAHRVDRERRQVAQIAAAGRRPESSSQRRASLALNSLLEPTRQPAIEQQALDQVAGHIRTSQHASDSRASVPTGGWDSIPHEHQITGARGATTWVKHAIGAERQAPGTPMPLGAVGARWGNAGSAAQNRPRFSSTATTVPADLPLDLRSALT